MTTFHTTPPKVILKGDKDSFDKDSLSKTWSVPNSLKPAERITPMTFCLLCSMFMGLLMKDLKISRAVSVSITSPFLLTLLATQALKAIGSRSISFSVSIPGTKLSISN